MWNPDSNQKNRIITRRILAEVKRYFDVHGKGLEMRILSCKYAKALNSCGGFPESVAAMAKAGELAIEVLEGGARLVLPGTGKPEHDDSAIWY